MSQSGHTGGLHGFLDRLAERHPVAVAAVGALVLPLAFGTVSTGWYLRHRPTEEALVDEALVRLLEGEEVENATRVGPHTFVGFQVDKQNGQVCTVVLAPGDRAVSKLTLRSSSGENLSDTAPYKFVLPIAGSDQAFIAYKAAKCVSIKGVRRAPRMQAGATIDGVGYAAKPAPVNVLSQLLAPKTPPSLLIR